MFTGLKVNWKVIYDFLYVFPKKKRLQHALKSLWNTACWILNDLDLTIQCNPRSNLIRETQKVTDQFLIKRIKGAKRAKFGPFEV